MHLSLKCECPLVILQQWPHASILPSIMNTDFGSMKLAQEWIAGMQLEVQNTISTSIESGMPQCDSKKTIVLDTENHTQSAWYAWI